MNARRVKHIAVCVFAAAAWSAVSTAASLPVPPQASPPPAVPGEEAIQPSRPPSGAFESAVAEGRKLLEAGDAAAAAERYEEAVRARPDSAEAVYNLGVARYREGKFADASRAFQRAATLSSQGDPTNPRLAADSLYNRAAGFYGATREQAAAAQKALAQREHAGPDQPTPDFQKIDPEALKQAIQDARTSLQGFKDAATADPGDRDSRVNAEQSSRLIRVLEELQQMQQEQDKQQNQQQSKDQQNQDKQDKQDQQDQQQQQEQQQQQQDKQDQQDQKSQESKDQQQQDQQDKSKDGEPSKDPKDNQQGKDGNDSEEQQSQDQKEQAQKEQQQQEPSPSDQEKDAQKDKEKQEPGKEGQAGKEGTQEMTQDEADRLLQAVRDAEKKRRAQQEAREAQRQSRQRPPAKDW